MTRANGTLPPAYFEALYASDPDPWRFASSDYEREKYSVTLDVLPRPRYASALEIGCSIGVLTQRLAERCDRLLAVDAAAAPLEQARRRCAQLPFVRFEQRFVPDQWPDGVFDLIVLSEVVYYFNTDDVARLAAKVAAALGPNGDLVLVHWTGATNYPLSGDEAAELFLERLSAIAEVEDRRRYPAFRLERLRRREVGLAKA